MPVKSHVITDAQALRRFEAIGKYLLSQEEWAVFITEDDLSPDARGKYTYNLALIVRVAVFWLLRDLEADSVPVEALRAMVAEYEANPGKQPNMAHILLSDSVVIRLDKIQKRLEALGVAIRKVNRHPRNVQALLHVALLHAWGKVQVGD